MIEGDISATTWSTFDILDFCPGRIWQFSNLDVRRSYLIDLKAGYLML